MGRGVEAEIVERHATEVGLLWPLRDRAVRDAAYDLASLGALDERVEANLDGLRLAGEPGWSAARALLDGAGPGEVFSAMALAVHRRDMRGVAHVLDVIAADAALARGAISALGWCTFEEVERVLPGLLSKRGPATLQVIGISACALHRRHPGPALLDATTSSDVRLRARSLLAIGELGVTQLLSEVRGELASSDERCRFAAAWTGALLGDATAVAALCEIASGDGALAEAACEMAMRRGAPVEASRWLEHLARGERTRRAAVAGAGALGDPTTISWLLELLDDKVSARVAAGAIAAITGVDLRAAHLAAAPPAGHEEGPTDDPADADVAIARDADLAWPEPIALRAWWARERGRTRPGQRLFLGRPSTADWLAQVLRAGNQPQRAAAAVERALASAGVPLFEVRAPAFRQGARLA